MGTDAHDRDRRPEPPPFAEWLLEQGVLRGPYLFIDYWANVFGLDGVVPERHVRSGLVSRSLFRLGIDRPDLEVPRFRALLLVLVLPLYLAFRRRFQTRQRLRFLRPAGEEIEAMLAVYRLDMDPAGDGRVHVRRGDTVLAEHVLDPRRLPGFSSLFWATYKLPLAALAAILIAAAIAGGLYAAGHAPLTARFWLPVGVPVLVLLLYALFRDVATAVLGTLPVLIGRYLFTVLDPEGAGWVPFLWAIAGLAVLFLVIDWLFMPRPVPPALLLYTADGPGRPYAREEDAPWWLEGRAYWVWRYLILTPAELNKFWERDWERVDLWIRADGAEAGMLEWVVTDMHYRELWIPAPALGDEDFADHAAAARAAVAEGTPGFWLVEVDADLVFHYPFFRNVSFVEDRGAVPVRGFLHVLRGLRERVFDRPEAVERAERALAQARLRLGTSVLGDLPELVAPRARRHMLAQPWRFWRYPLGAAARRESRLYAESRPNGPRPAVSDPELQIKDPSASA